MNRSSYIICGVKYKIKKWIPCLKIVKNFRIVIAEHSTKPGPF